MSTVELLAGGGDLRGPSRVVKALAGDAGHDGPALTPEDRAALEAAGALPGGRLHPRLAGARATIAAPLVRLALERGERRGLAWLGAEEAVLLHPLGGGRSRLAMVPSPLLVDALVRINDVGPRPRPQPAVRISLPAGTLAEVIAARDPSRASGLDGDAQQALSALLAGLREHWRVTARWTPAAASAGIRTLEVLDSDAGYWLIAPGGDGTVELWPGTPTTVFRALCQLVPLVSEMGDTAA